MNATDSLEASIGAALFLGQPLAIVLFGFGNAGEASARLIGVILQGFVIGLPAFTLVGLPETEVKEARDRVRAASESGSAISTSFSFFRACSGKNSQLSSLKAQPISSSTSAITRMHFTRATSAMCRIS